MIKQTISAILALTIFSMAWANGFERQKYNFNSDWKLMVGDIAGAEKPAYDDSGWKTVTLPQAFNEDEAFAVDIIDLTDTVMWYRKHFQVDELAGKKVFIEFEGVRQAGDFYINGHHLGLHENGVMAVGFDLTPYMTSGDNVVAVRVDNATGILGSSTLDWNSGYTALDYDFEAVLYVEVRGQEIEVNRLPLTLNAIDPIALSADENISLTRPVGKNLVIKPWQYLTINGVVEYDGNKNNTEYKNLAQASETTTNGEDIGNGPVEYWQITSINDGTLVPYGGELTFDSANMRLIYAASGTPVENQSKLYTYDPTLGTITFTNDFSSLAGAVSRCQRSSTWATKYPLQGTVSIYPSDLRH